MRSLSEMFEFLSNCNTETIITELNEHCNHLVQKNGTKSPVITINNQCSFNEGKWALIPAGRLDNQLHTK